MKSTTGARTSLQRQYALATAVFAILVLGIIFLFGHLISRSLSRRYLQDMLISGREEAERIADELRGDGGVDLEVVSKRREALLRTLAGAAQKQVWESIEAVDREGNVVFTLNLQSTEELPEALAADLEIDGTLTDQHVQETESSYQITVPLGEVGEVVLNVSKGRIAERIVHLRRELLAQTITAAVLTMATLVVAFVLVWFLIQRTRRLEDQRREAEELAALGTLAANLAHEIRNPLNSINLNLELLEEDLAGGDQEATSSLQTTRKEVGRLARLVNDFLTYARPTEPAREKLRVDVLLEDAIAFLRREARTMGVHLRLAPGSSDGVVAGDPGQLRQVVFNLVLNAVQAVSDLDPERRVVEVSAEGGIDEVSMIVRDRGPGIPAGDIEQVRRAFFTKRRFGSGLGLAIADRIVVAHGGRVELVNLEPFGLEARVVLPIAG